MDRNQNSYCQSHYRNKRRKILLLSTVHVLSFFHSLAGNQNTCCESDCSNKRRKILPLRTVHVLFCLSFIHSLKIKVHAVKVIVATKEKNITTTSSIHV